MTEQEALALMVAPGTRRPGKYREGVIQIWVTRACDKSCFNCTQGSNYRGPYQHMPPEMFEEAVKSLKGYFGVVGVFGGNPAVHPQFIQLCRILAQHIPWEQRGLWSNNPINLDNARAMRETFNPAVSNLNVHLDRKAYNLFKQGWPESRPVGLETDSRHSPVFVAMKDVLKKVCPVCKGYKSDDLDCKECDGTGLIYDEARAWELISRCDINQHWSAMLGMFRGQLRAWFCEIAGAQSIIHQDDPSYPDTGIKIDGPEWDRHDGGPAWWQYGMNAFAHQVRKHCHECGVPLRGYGELAQAIDCQSSKEDQPQEQVSQTHADVCQPKRPRRLIETVTNLEQLNVGKLQKMTHYLQNAKR